MVEQLQKLNIDIVIVPECIVQVSDLRNQCVCVSCEFIIACGKNDNCTLNYGTESSMILVLK